MLIISFSKGILILFIIEDKLVRGYVQGNMSEKWG